MKPNFARAEYAENQANRNRLARDIKKARAGLISMGVPPEERNHQLWALLEQQKEKRGILPTRAPLLRQLINAHRNHVRTAVRKLHGSNMPRRIFDQKRDETDKLESHIRMLERMYRFVLTNQHTRL